MRLDERIPNLVLKINVDNFLPMFWTKMAKIAEHTRFLYISSSFLPKTGVRNYQNVFLRPDLESSRRDASVGAIFKVLSIIFIFGLIWGTENFIRCSETEITGETWQNLVCMDNFHQRTRIAWDKSAQSTFIGNGTPYSTVTMCSSWDEKLHK